MNDCCVPFHHWHWYHWPKISLALIPLQAQLPHQSRDELANLIIVTVTLEWDHGQFYMLQICGQRLVDSRNFRYLSVQQSRAQWLHQDTLTGPPLDSCNDNTSTEPATARWKFQAPRARDFNRVIFPLTTITLWQWCLLLLCWHGQSRSVEWMPARPISFRTNLHTIPLCRWITPRPHIYTI